MKLILVRHGETVENKLRILQGHLPGRLTSCGLEQVAQTARRLKESGVVFDQIVSSDLQRALQSAAIIASEYGGEEVVGAIVKTELLRERNWGEYTGMPIDEARDKFYYDGAWHFPGDYETEEMLYQRGRDVLDYFRANFSEDATILVVSHGLMLRYLIAALFQCAFREVTPFVNAEARELTL